MYTLPARSTATPDGLLRPVNARVIGAASEGETVSDRSWCWLVVTKVTVAMTATVSKAAAATRMVFRRKRPNGTPSTTPPQRLLSQRSANRLGAQYGAARRNPRR